MMETAYPESPLDLEEAAYPCKGCGEVRDAARDIRAVTDFHQILEEGKAFELGEFALQA